MVEVRTSCDWLYKPQKCYSCGQSNPACFITHDLSILAQNWPQIWTPRSWKCQKQFFQVSTHDFWSHQKFLPILILHLVSNYYLAQFISVIMVSGVDWTSIRDLDWPLFCCFEVFLYVFLFASIPVLPWDIRSSKKWFVKTHYFNRINFAMKLW